MKLKQLMVHGKQVDAGGLQTDGMLKSGMCWLQTAMTKRLDACLCLIVCVIDGIWRRSMTSHPGEYIELHAASAFSFLAGSSQPEAFIERAVEIGMPSIALADRNGLYGVARFHTAAKRSNVRAHIGAEVAVSSFGNRLTPHNWLPHQHPDEPSRIVLLCASQIGYQNLCQLITRFKMREVKKAEGAATLEDLEEFSAGLICMTGGDEGPLAAALAHGGE